MYNSLVSNHLDTIELASDGQNIITIDTIEIPTDQTQKLTW